MSQALPHAGLVLGPFLARGAAGGPKRSLAALAALPSPAFSSSNWHCETSTRFLLQGYVRAATMS